MERSFKGVVDWFFSRLDCVYGVQVKHVFMLSCFKNALFFHIIYLYSTPLCPFSDKRPDYFRVLWSLSLRNTQWALDWLAGPVCCDWLNRLYCASERPAPRLSGMCSGCIVNNSVMYIAYQFEPDWDTADISEEDRAEPLQVRLLMVCFFVVVVGSYF